MIVPATDSAIADAAERLSAGDIVAIPTETVYGLAADAAQGEAVAKIYAAKGRPSFNPLIAHVTDADMAARHAEVGRLAAKLMAAFWPGPLTLVLPARGGDIASLVTAGLGTIALRAPAHPVPRALIAALGRPLAAPSANASGRISPTTAQHVAASLGDRVPLILDGGACDIGLESTIVAVEDERLRLLRPGSVTAKALSEHAPVDAAGGGIVAPGMMASHYAPSKPLRLDAEAARAGEYLIGFGDVQGDANLSPAARLTEAAANLFACLHAADASESPGIAVAPIPHDGLGVAINDRLARAATR